MSKVQFERIWIEQCQAARRVKEHFGLAGALDYLIGEKLLSFAKVAEQRAEFIQELPDFLQEIRAVFSLEETSEYGSAAPTRIPTACCANTSQRALISRSILRGTSIASPLS